MQMLLEGKTAVVTGAGSGIGQASASAMAREGASVAILDSNEAAGQQTANELIAQKFNAEFFPLNVANEEQVRAVMAQIINKFGRIDILHNNAGIAIRHTVAEQDEQGWQTCMDVNLKGIFLCAKHVIPHMLDRGGSIINTASVTGIVGVRNRAAYSATKGAVVALTRNMALDYAGEGLNFPPGTPEYFDTLAGMVNDNGKVSILPENQSARAKTRLSDAQRKDEDEFETDAEVDCHRRGARTRNCATCRDICSTLNG